MCAEYTFIQIGPPAPAHPGTPIAGPTVNFTGGNQVQIDNADTDDFTPTDTQIVQNNGTPVNIGGVRGGNEHVLFQPSSSFQLQNLQNKGYVVGSNGFLEGYRVNNNGISNTLGFQNILLI